MLRCIYLLAPAFAMAVAMPPQTSSKGFHLVAQLQDPRHDLNPPAQGLSLQGYHIGAGRDVAVLSSSNKTNPAPVFYLNGTGSSVSSIVSDRGSFPYGLTVPPPGRASPQSEPALLVVGPGSPATVQSDGKIISVVNTQGKGTFMACHCFSTYYNRMLTVLEFAYSSSTAAVEEYDEEYEDDEYDDYEHRLALTDARPKNITARPGAASGCVKIHLAVRCAPSSRGSTIRPDFARAVPCYAGIW